VCNRKTLEGTTEADKSGAVFGPFPARHTHAVGTATSLLAPPGETGWGEAAALPNPSGHRGKESEKRPRPGPRSNRSDGCRPLNARQARVISLYFRVALIACSLPRPVAPKPPRIQRIVQPAAPRPRFRLRRLVGHRHLAAARVEPAEQVPQRRDRGVVLAQRDLRVVLGESPESFGGS